MSNATTLKVGDELAFAYGGTYERWVIHRIDKITPSGRIKAGGFELNPDLSIRGNHGWRGPSEGEPVTDEIRQEMRRQQHGYIVGAMKWRDLSNDQLSRIVAIVQEKPAE